MPVLSGKPGVRNARHRSRRVRRQKTDRLAHVLGTRRAIQTDHVDAQRFERRHRARDVGAEQHASARVERDLRLNRDASSDLGEQPLEAGDRRLHLENVLGRLDEQHVDAAFDEILRLRVVVLFELGEGRVRQHRVAAREEQARRTDRAGDETRLVRRGVLVARRAREARRRDVQLARLLLDAPFAQPMRRRLKGARLDDVAADREKRLVDGLDDVGAGEHEVVVAPLERLAAEVLRRRMVQLNVRPHRAVVHQHPIRQGAQVTRSARHESADVTGIALLDCDIDWSDKRKMPATQALGLAL